MKLKTLSLWVAIAIVSTALIPKIGLASIVQEVELTCPLDGSKFKALQAIPGTAFGLQLDLKPAIFAPLPMARCTSNGFVLYKQEFTPQEIARLKQYVNSPTYQTLVKTNTDYFLAANLIRFMNYKPELIADYLLQATWEVDREPQRYRRYATAALAQFQQLSTDSTVDKKNLLLYQLLIGELERRLGQFSQAKQHFLKLQSQTEFKKDPYKSIIEFQLQLIAAKKSNRQFTPLTPY